VGSKDKLKRFKENETFENVIQPNFDEVWKKDYKLKNIWSSEFFKNENKLILELGCGKGEYAVNLAEKCPHQNFIGIDIKGARFWRGAKTAIEKGIKNVGFIRTRIEFLESFFGTNEVSEIWITFPDPQLKSRRTKKRLTSSRFLNMYKDILPEDGIVHLKTDSQELHEYTKAILAYNNQEVLVCTNDLYNSEIVDDILSIKTFYEKSYLEIGKPITYIQFKISKKIIELPVEEDEPISEE